MKTQSRVFLITVLAGLLSACGGGGGGGGGEPAIETGIFKDSNVAGMSFVSGSQSGVTGADGSFTYERGQDVTFSLGGVIIGTATGAGVVTPVDLVNNGTPSSNEVRNIVRFLIMLDSDGDPDNGITISAAVQSVADTWTPIDFATADLDTAAATYVSDVSSADSRTAVLPDAEVAQTHLESTLRCSYSGAFRGTYSGDDRGTFGALVDATTGDVYGVAYSIPFDVLVSLASSEPIDYSQDVVFVIGNSGFATFTGQFDSFDSGSGTWVASDSRGSASGTMTASRIGGSVDAVYRFTGQYTGDDSGLFTFDIDASDNITGVSYSVEFDQLDTLNVMLDGTSVSGTVSGGAVVNGTLNKETGALSGTWSNAADGTSGTFEGGGCKLN